MELDRLKACANLEGRDGGHGVTVVRKEEERKKFTAYMVTNGTEQTPVCGERQTQIYMC